jgi:ATP-dependent RNA helicase RhlE
MTPLFFEYFLSLAGFRDGSYRILAATDIAARGIDVSQISHVINYDIPDTAEGYIHRIGRTGRASRRGDAITLVTPEDDGMVRVIERLLSKPLERRTLTDFDYRIPAPAWTVDVPARPAPRHFRRHKAPINVVAGASRKNQRARKSSGQVNRD